MLVGDVPATNRTHRSLVIEPAVLDVCGASTLRIVARNALGQPVDDGLQAFYIEVHGPALVVPRFVYQGRGVYEARFAPPRPGTYAVIARLDYARGADHAHCDPRASRYLIGLYMW
jgi:hypothetical protein